MHPDPDCPLDVSPGFNVASAGNCRRRRRQAVVKRVGKLRSAVTCTENPKMRIVGTLIATFMALALNSSYADLSIPDCSPGIGSVTVVLSKTKGKWLGFSGRTSSGRIVDYPPVKMSQSGTLVTTFGLGANGGQVFELGHEGRGISEARASTWKKYNTKTKSDGRSNRRYRLGLLQLGP